MDVTWLRSKLNYKFWCSRPTGFGFKSLILFCILSFCISACPSSFADKSLLLLDDAYRLYNKNQYAKALAEMNEAVRLKPNQQDLLLARSHMNIYASKYKESIEDCNAVLKLNPRSAGAFSRRGYCYCCLGKFDKGAADLSRSIELNQIDKAGWDGWFDYQNRAKAYRRLNKSELASKDEQMLVVLSSIDHARKYREKIQLAPAMTIMNQAVQKKPDDLYLRYFRGIVSMNDGRLDTAIADLTFVAQHDPFCISAYYFRGDCYSRMHRVKEAIDDFSRIIAKKPYLVAISDTAETGRCKGKELTYDESIVKLSDIYVLRALQYGQIKQFDKALKDLNQSISMEPSDVEARQERVDIYLALKNYPEAIKEINSVVAQEPNNYKVYEIRASVFEACNQPEKAIADYTTVIGLSGKDPGAYLLRGQLYDRLHRYEKAIADFSAVTKLNPAEDDAFRYRGDSFFKLGRYANAADDYSKAIALDRGGNIQAYSLRAQAYEKLGRKDLAAQDRHAAEQSKQKKI